MKYFLLLIFLLAANCPGNTVSLKKATSDHSSATQSVPEDTLITLERSPCDAKCPAYKLTIAADGGVVFEGHSYVKEIGIVRSKITQEQLKQLVVEFERIKYFSLNDRYSIVPDGCAGYSHHGIFIITSLRMNGESKRVMRNTGCLGAVPKLKMLEDRIDEVVGTKQWVS